MNYIFGRNPLTYGKTAVKLLIISVVVSLSFSNLAFSQQAAPGKLMEPSSRERMIARVVEIMLNSSHLSKKPTDETLSERAFDQYFKTLDPMKVYFYQSDVDEFYPLRKELGKMTTAGDLSFAYNVFNRYLQRIDERIQTVDQLLDKPLDLNTNEEVVVDPKLLNYPKDKTEANDRWERRIKYELLALKADEIENAKKKQEKAEKEAKNAVEEGKEPPATTQLASVPDQESLQKRLKIRYKFYNKRMQQTSNEDLLELFLTALANSYDPHTSYMSPKNYENFIIQMRLNLDGIGATLQSIDGLTVVNKLVPDGPAEKSEQIKPDDRVVAVGQGTDGPMEDVYGMKLDEVVSKVRGRKGTQVRLEIVDSTNIDKYADYKEEGKPKPPTKTVTITRDKVQLKDQAAKSEVFDFGTKPDGTPFKLGVIDLPSFYSDSAAIASGDPNSRSASMDVKRILKKFVDENVDAVVLDLRNNGGGFLHEVVSLTGLFIETGTVVLTKDIGPKANELSDRDQSVDWTGPLVVVVNKFSASASEIFAGAIKEYKRGLIVGDSTTHGKGSVQDLRDVGRNLFGPQNASALGALKLTVNGYYLPDGISPQLHGVKSDVVFPSIVDNLEDISEKDLDYALVFDDIPASKNYPKFPYVNEKLVDELRKDSAARIASSPDFQKVERDIKTYVEYKAKKTRTLNEKKFFEEREKLKAEKDETDKISDELSGGTDKINRDFYLDEVMSTTLDYLKVLNSDGVSFPKEKASRGTGFLNSLLKRG